MFLWRAARDEEALARKTHFDLADYDTPALQIRTAAWVSSMGDLGQAERLYRQAIANWERLANEKPDSPVYQKEIADTLVKLGWVLRGAGRINEAERSYRQALEIYASLVLRPTAMMSEEVDRAIQQLRHDLSSLLEASGHAADARAAARHAAAFWQKMVTDRPEVVRNWLELGHSYEQSASWAEAIAVYSRAIERFPQNGSVLLGRGEAYLALKDPDKALADISMAIRLEPQNALCFRKLRDLISDQSGQPIQSALLERAELELLGTPQYTEWCAIRGRFPEATALMLKQIESNPQEHFLWFQTAFLYAHSGDVAVFRRHCREMLKRFGDTQDPIIADRVARGCLILSGTPDELRMPRQLADRSITLTLPQHAFFSYPELAQALAEYRAGQFASTLEWLKKFLAHPGGMGTYGTGMAQLLQAMAKLRQVDNDEAQQLFAEARQFCDRLPQITHGQLLHTGDWQDGLGVEVLRREAEEIFKKATSKDVSTEKPEVVMVPSDSLKFEDLINGRDLTGWNVIGEQSNWEVDKLVLTATGKGGIGWLLTDKEYADFVLRLEYQAEPRANSGIGILASPADFHQLELQLVNGDSSSTGGMWLPSGRGFSYLPATQSAKEKPVSEWNSLEIELRTRKLKTRVNGTEVSQFNLTELSSRSDAIPPLKRIKGRIGVQSHNGVVRFRNLQVAEIAPPK